MDLTSIKSKLHNKNIFEIGWLILGQVISIALGFVSMKLLSKMGTVEFGKYSLVLSLAALISAVLYGPAEQGFVRFYYEYLNKGRAKTYVGQFYKFHIKTGSICLAVTVLVILGAILTHSSQRPVELLIIGLYIIISTSSNIYNSMINILRQRKINTILQVTERCLTIILLFITIAIYKIDANMAFLSLLLALIIVIILKTLVLNKYVPLDSSVIDNETDKIRTKINNNITSFALPFAIWGATSWLQSSSERWVIAKYLSTADVGIYSIMAVLANYLVAIPSGIVGQFAQPIIYEKTSAVNDIERKQLGIKALRYYVLSILLLSVLAVIFSLIFGERVILIVSNKEFCKHWQLLPVLCMGVGLFQVGQALTTVGFVENVPQKYLFAKIFSGVFAVVSNILFISFMGISGIAVSICVASVIYLLLVIYANHKLKQGLKDTTVSISHIK